MAVVRKPWSDDTDVESILFTEAFMAGAQNILDGSQTPKPPHYPAAGRRTATQKGTGGVRHRDTWEVKRRSAARHRQGGSGTESVKVHVIEGASVCVCVCVCVCDCVSECVCV